MKAADFARMAGLALICMLVFLPGIASLPVTDRDEARFVQASRQMIESGDYLDIRFQDVARYKKPIGIYWLQTAAAELVGQADNPPIWSFRLVSFIGALVAVLATLWIATSLFGASAGFVAGCAIAASFGLGFEARIAKTDAFLLATIVLAQGALARIYIAYREKRDWPSFAPWLFWGAQGVGILIKGPVTPLVSLLTIGALLICDRKRGWVRELRFWRGLGVVFLLVAPWLAAITWKSGGAFWSEAVGRDLLGKVAQGQESHGFPPGYYSITYSLFLWPIGYLGLLAGLNALNRARFDPRLMFLLAWYVPLWIAFEMIPTKLPHYMLPAYPAATIAIGWFLTDPDSRAIPLALWQRFLSYLGLFGLAVVTSALVVFPLGLTGYFGTGGWVAAGLASLAALVSGVLGSPFGGRTPALLRIPAMALLAGVFFGLTTGVILPRLDPVWVSREIADIYDAGKPCPDSVLTVVGYEEPSIVFLAGSRTRFADVASAAAGLAEDAKCAVVAVTATNNDAFQAAASANGVVPEPIGSISGINYSNGNQVEATLFVAR